MIIRPYSTAPTDIVIELRVPAGLAHVIDPDIANEFRAFFQMVLNRRIVGALRYGEPPTAKQNYMGRMGKELQAYRAIGNVEQLLNIANYAFLESYAPQNKKIHFNPAAESVTRAKFGGNIR